MKVDLRQGEGRHASECGRETHMKLQLHPCQSLNSTFAFTPEYGIRPYQLISQSPTL